jgi:hypothetical protein
MGNMLTKRTKMLLLVAALMVTVSMLWTGVIRRSAHPGERPHRTPVVVENSTNSWEPPGWVDPPLALKLLWILGTLFVVIGTVSVLVDVYRRRAQRWDYLRKARD